MHLPVGGDDTDNVGCLGQAADVEAVGVAVVGDLAAPPCFERFRKRKGMSYYELYCEKWANRFGDQVCGNRRVFCRK